MLLLIGGLFFADWRISFYHLPYLPYPPYRAYPAYQANKAYKPDRADKPNSRKPP